MDVVKPRDGRDLRGETVLLPAANTTWTEGDVETQIALPLLTRSELLGIDTLNIKSKEFLARHDIGKGASSRKGYVPDFCVYLLSLPVVAVEIKAPGVQLSEAWNEASLYAHALNRSFNASVNPCNFVFATNGLQFAAGKWDSATPDNQGDIADLLVGSQTLADLQNLLGAEQLERYAQIASAAVRFIGFKKPSSNEGGQSLMASKLEPNTFAADLSPILRRYFSSRDQNSDPEIYKNAYVSSNEITSYDKVLESFLVDRLSRSKTRTEVKTTKKRAPDVTRRLADLTSLKPQSGELQLITGGVGSGKSLFARRYKELLQPDALSTVAHWAFIDFLFAPDDLRDAEEWVYKTFVQSLFDEGLQIDLRDPDEQEKVFAADIADREAFYFRMSAAEPGRGMLERARDIEGWRQDPERSAKALARYIEGDKGEILIVVFDNVDRRDAEDQLGAFQLALWFMNQVRCLVILQMRDTTFEAHKDERPLDTYKTGQVFHIGPPRFIDVVKRRLELSLNELARQAPQTIKYRTPSGATISYPKSRAGAFLKGLYLELFERTNNVSRVLEALAGRNVRKALDMFMSIITSGHMPEDLITKVASGYEMAHFPEHLVLRILMRQDYRFYAENRGFTANVFYCDNTWVRPSNLLIPELLFFLIEERKTPGDNGQLGFVSFERLLGHLERLGFVRSDAFAAAQYTLGNELIEADSATVSKLEISNCVKASASGWAHMRILAARTEYVASVLPTTALNDSSLGSRVYDLMIAESRFGKLFPEQRIQVVELFHKYLRSQFAAAKAHPGYHSLGKNGSSYILKQIEDAVHFSKSGSRRAQEQFDWLDA
jgi:hypothetical protein